MAELTRNFRHLSKTDVAIAGGKGASLGEMTQAGIPVPPGFVLLAGTFDRFLAETDIDAEIDAILDTVQVQEMHTIENASEKIQSLILAARMPEDIAAEIVREYEALHTPFVAVRSSATAEDSASAAWAGQLDSFLNTTKETLLHNVQECWASLFTPRAIFYRFEQGMHKEKVSVAVVVQKMVESEMSGIAFSVHPVTEDRNQLIIEAGFGLGEALVSGQVTPDSYVVTKEPRVILNKNVATQTRALYRKAEGGSEWRDLPQSIGGKQALSDERILELSQIIITIENHYSFPCDVEWAFEDGTFFVVQSRPITTLSRKESKQEYRKFMNRALFLIACETWDMGERVKLPKACGNIFFFDPLFAYEPHRSISIYYNLTDPNQHPKFLIDHFLEDPERLEDLKRKFDADAAKIQGILKDEDPTYLHDLFELISDVWPLIAISNFLGGFDEEWGKTLGLTPALKQRCYDIRHETDAVMYRAEEARLRMVRKAVPDEYKPSVEFLTFDEVRSGVMPSQEMVRERQSGYIYHLGKLYPATRLQDFASRNNFNTTEDSANESNSETETVRGTSACAGSVRGVAKIVFERGDIEKVEAGDILVTPMTTPNLIEAMKRAAAFVTDEGGITCHAAIVARELKKPCIIGTKVATQVLKDGDLVEVDANAGIVRILNPENPFGDMSQWQRLFRVQGLRFFIDDIFMEYYRTLGALTFVLNDEFSSYLPRTVVERTLAEGSDRISDPEKFQHYQTEFRAYMEDLQSYITSLSYETASRKEVEKLLREISRLFYYYSKTEFFSTDGAYNLFEGTGDKKIGERLERMGQIKNSGRAFLNSMFFGADATLPKLLKSLEQRFNVAERILQQYSREEILALFDGKRVSDAEIKRRGEAFYMIGKDGALIIKTGGEACKDIRSFVGNTDREHTKTIEGTCAHSGKARGTARVIRAGYDNFDTLHHLMDAMQKGDILVAETTSPELMPACKKAGGIITDQGGMLSHAAIVSRELSIPCIVGTSNATESIKNGDLIEMDGTSGTVEIIERSPQTPILNAADYIPFTNHTGVAPYFFSYGFFTHIKDMEAVLFWDGTNRKSFVSKKAVQRTLQEGLSLYSDDKKYTALQDDIKKAFAAATQHITALEQRVTPDAIAAFLDAATELSALYRYTEFFYTDRAFQQKETSPVIQKNFETFEEFKLEGRRMINTLSYGNTSYMRRLLQCVAHRFSMSMSDLEWYKAPELFAPFDQTRVNEATIAARKSQYGMYANEQSEITEVYGDDARPIIKAFATQPNKTALRGQVASRGQATGRARVAHIDVTSFENISTLLRDIKPGEILVADSTIPELIPACKVAAGIVTNQGGMMSHAAIVARELNIPCIVGVEHATDHIHTGDQINMDATTGIVTILEQI